jgi:hypothetical protein
LDGGDRAASAEVSLRAQPSAFAQDVIVPKAQHAISFGFDNRGPHRIGLFGVLPAVDLDHELRPMAGKVGDEVADLNLSAPAGFGR